MIPHLPFCQPQKSTDTETFPANSMNANNAQACTSRLPAEMVLFYLMINTLTYSTFSCALLEKALNYCSLMISSVSVYTKYATMNIRSCVWSYCEHEILIDFKWKYTLLLGKLIKFKPSFLKFSNLQIAPNKYRKGVPMCRRIFSS